MRFSSFLTRVFGAALTRKLRARLECGDLEGTLSYRAEMSQGELCKYSLLNFPMLTGISILKFYFELRLYFLPPGICCIFDESSSDLAETTFHECKKVILGDQVILGYKGGSRFSWLKFYFSSVFPVVRKGGLVFIKVASGSRFMSQQILVTTGSSRGIVDKILASNESNIFAGSESLYNKEIRLKL